MSTVYIKGDKNKKKGGFVHLKEATGTWRKTNKGVWASLWLSCGVRAEEGSLNQTLQGCWYKLLIGRTSLGGAEKILASKAASGGLRGRATSMLFWKPSKWCCVYIYCSSTGWQVTSGKLVGLYHSSFSHGTWKGQALIPDFSRRGRRGIFEF